MGMSGGGSASNMVMPGRKKADIEIYDLMMIYGDINHQQWWVSNVFLAKAWFNIGFCNGNVQSDVPLYCGCLVANTAHALENTTPSSSTLTNILGRGWNHHGWSPPKGGVLRGNMRIPVWRKSQLETSGHLALPGTELWWMIFASR